MRCVITLFLISILEILAKYLGQIETIELSFFGYAGLTTLVMLVLGQDLKEIFSKRL